MTPRFTALLTVFSLLACLPALSSAQEKHGKDCAACHKLSEKEAAEIFKPVGVTVKSIKPSPAAGLFEILLEKDGKPGLALVDFGKKFAIQGVMMKLPNFEPVTSHDMPKPKQLTMIAPQSIPVENAIVIGNPKGTKKLYVFTDPDCPYCRTFHGELKKLEKLAPDVAIQIMLMPLPMHPLAFDKSRAALEAGSREVLDNAFEGKEVPKPAKEESKAKVNAIIKFAETNGINGTPTMVLPDGTVQVGGRDAEALKKLLEGK